MWQLRKEPEGREHISIAMLHDGVESTFICAAMPGLSNTSLRECLKAEDAWASTIFVLFNIKSLQGTCMHQSIRTDTRRNVPLEGSLALA